jgi:hypothetical protein
MSHITRKVSDLFKKGLNLSEFAFKKNRNVYKMPRILKNKKAWHFQKKSPAAIAALPQWPVRS